MKKQKYSSLVLVWAIMLLLFLYANSGAAKMPDFETITHSIIQFHFSGFNLILRVQTEL